MKIEYDNGDGLFLIKVSKDKYYYGNGKDINSFGISANQFLRFNPYMDKSKIKNVPQKILKIIEKEMNAKDERRKDNR